MVCNKNHNTEQVYNICHVGKRYFKEIYVFLQFPHFLIFFSDIHIFKTTEKKRSDAFISCEKRAKLHFGNNFHSLNQQGPSLHTHRSFGEWSRRREHIDINQEIFLSRNSVAASFGLFFFSSSCLLTLSG